MIRRSLSAAVLASLVMATSALAATVVPDGGFVVAGSGASAIREIEAAHDADASWVSISASWEELEPTKGSYRALGGQDTPPWTDLRAQLVRAKALGLRVELRLVNAPGWASGRAGSDDPPTPANLPAYGTFLSDLGTILGPYIDAYSPWNEPNRTAFWNPPDADAFTALQKAAYPAIKATDPTAVVVYGPVVGRYAGIDSGYTFLRRSYQLGLKGAADVIGWNGYPSGPPESPNAGSDGVPAASTLPAQLYLRGIIDQYDPGRRVWILETGWSTCSPCDVSAGNGTTEAQQADYLTRAFEYRRRYLSSYVDRIFWFQLRDSGTDRGAWAQNEGVLRNDFSPKPALAAFRALAVEVPAGTSPDPSVVATPVGGAPGALPPASRTTLPAKLRTAKGSVAIGRPVLTGRKGVFRLRFRVTVTGGPVRTIVEGFRGSRWRTVARVRVPRTGTVTVRFVDRAFTAIRIRATAPGKKGWRVARLVKVPVRRVP